MDEMTKESLLQKFRAYLDSLPENTEDRTDVTTRQGDMYSLLAELTALKSEVRTEARLVKNGLDEFRAAFDTVERTNRTLVDELAESRLQKQDVKKEALRPVFLSLLELYDRLSAGVESLQGYKSSFWTCFCGKEKTLITAAGEGQRMNLGRLEQLLAEFRVQPIAALGKIFDPACMRAVETENVPDKEQGVVTGEVRRGFLWNGDTLRYAEVRVNKNSL